MIWLWALLNVFPITHPKAKNAPRHRFLHCSGCLLPHDTHHLKVLSCWMKLWYVSRVIFYTTCFYWHCWLHCPDGSFRNSYAFNGRITVLPSDSTSYAPKCW